jgi:hypothetical protein
MPEPKNQGPRRIEVPETVRHTLRTTVGEPPSHVTVHEGVSAANMTDAVNAEAFTHQGQIYFADDAPVASERGQQLLAHELTHVMQQQGRSASMPGEHTDEGRHLEQAARLVEDRMAQGPDATVQPVPMTPRAEKNEAPQLHHRVTPASAPAAGAQTASPPTAASSSNAISTRAGSDVSQQYSGGDFGVQRKVREPSKAILDGVGDVASSAWSKTRESLYGQLEQEFTGPTRAKKDPDSRAKRLERQAAELYPYLRRRLRAELVRDLERRGRL